MTPLKLALDWTPNTNHLGFYVGKELGYYAERTIDLNLITPDQDNYALTPAKKVELGKADLALCPMESIISYRTKSKPFNLVAIAALFQEDLSAIAVKEDSGIKTPKDLDGKLYASYEARYEDKIVEQMIKNDGGSGDLKISYPNKLGIWETLQKNKADATWIFLNWEGYQAEAAGVKMRYFKLKDYGIPYSYSPVLVVNGDKINETESTYKALLEATQKGFFYAEKNPKHAAEILNKYIPKEERKLDLEASITFSTAYMGNEQTWGTLAKDNIEKFLSWLAVNNLENTSLKAETLIYDLK